MPPSLPRPPWAAENAQEPPVVLDREAAREAAERELSKETYTQHEPGLFRRAVDWVWERVTELLDTAVVHAPGGWLGLFLILLAVAGLLLALRLRMGPMRAARRAERGRVFDEQPRTAAAHRAAADAHAAAGRWESAVQERTRALVRSLEERALIDDRPGRTADEAAADAGRSLPALADQLRAAAHTFDAVTYGGRRATAEDHARLHALDEEVRRTRPESHSAADESAVTGGAAR